LSGTAFQQARDVNEILTTGTSPEKPISSPRLNLPNSKFVSRSTTVLVFTRTARQEADSKHYFGKSAGRANTAVSAELIRTTLQEVRRSGLSYSVAWADQQRGGTFGQRLSNAITDVFNSGVEHVICIGSDAPNLKAVHLQHAASQLAQGKQVIGPDHRGGVYLIGLSRCRYNEDVFRSFSWNSGDVFIELKEWMRTGDGGIEVLEPLVDVNTLSDISRLFRMGCLNLFLFRIIQSILASLLPRFDLRMSEICSPNRWESAFLRGPPVA
jgi:hypothetical protein